MRKLWGIEEIQKENVPEVKMVKIKMMRVTGSSSTRREDYRDPDEAQNRRQDQNLKVDSEEHYQKQRTRLLELVHIERNITETRERYIEEIQNKGSVKTEEEVITYIQFAKVKKLRQLELQRGEMWKEMYIEENRYRKFLEEIFTPVENETESQRWLRENEFVLLKQDMEASSQRNQELAQNSRSNKGGQEDHHL